MTNGDLLAMVLEDMADHPDELRALARKSRSPEGMLELFKLEAPLYQYAAVLGVILAAIPDDALPPMSIIALWRAVCVQKVQERLAS